ncbi:spondin-1 [Anthonomus grandis grandis]|uniref:spondin-1 n=1 Tax=Anthonomus grandis grandis TaxID=2921223 RepID=UPI002166BF31|nr:spondin-1 [Anthonomus grandis grandis]
MIKYIVCWCLMVFYVLGDCPRVPSIYHSRYDKLPGDNGYHIKINENPEKYVPGKLYTLYLMGQKSINQLQQFQRFIINVESADRPDDLSPQKVGSFQLYGDNQTTFNEECVNTISEKSSAPKTEVFFMWAAPPPGSGCVTFRAMVLEDAQHWYADDGGLSKTFCEQTDKDIKFDENDCCACDEAKYSLIFEGIWSKKTHPKDYPFSLWLTHFSDVIGASHERNFSFWGEGQIASEGFRSLAEWGSPRMLETELRAKAKYLRTIIKAAGLWHPNVNTNTSTNFKVDRRHHLISVASMFGPSPDWVVGLNGLNLCLKNCSWIQDMTIDLYPYDAGTDSGITYMSPNAETNPREKMYRITTTYPEDPRAPFYDPSKSEMNPLARLYLKREKLIPKNCDENFLNAQLDVSENTEDTDRAECAVTEYSAWSDCSVSCGKGLRMRTRQYVMPQKAQMFQCNRQLISKEMCVAAIPECEGGSKDDSSEDELPIDSLPPASAGGVCSTSPWGAWSTCSETCGIGFKMRTRFFVDDMGRKKCPHISTVEKEKCMGPPCTSQVQEVQDPMCPTTDWSDWSPCSASCGKGVKFRQRLLLVAPELQQKCQSRVELLQQQPCMDTPECTLDMATAKVVCMQSSDQGPCQGYYNRWYFDSTKAMCIQFIYGGCRGNQNNFLTFEECMNTCSIVRDALTGNQPPSSANFNQPRTNQQNVNVSPGSQPVDCMITPWSSWSRCSATCGIGVEERFRMIKRPAAQGGKPCPTNLKKKRRCYGPVPCY